MVVNSEDKDWPSVSNLVRRHSFSLKSTKSSNFGSLALDLLKVTPTPQTIHLPEISKDLTGVVSDQGYFNSCQSNMDSSSDGDTSKVSPNAKKKTKKRNRKSSPTLEESHKRVNNGRSPPEALNNKNI